MLPHTYRSAMDHLVFSDNLHYDALYRAARRRPHRIFRAAVLAACLFLFTLVTSFAVSPQFRLSVLELLHVGSTVANTGQENYTTTATVLEADITYSYLTLPQGSGVADLQDGALFFDGQHFWALTEENQLRQLPGSVVKRQITWDGWDYQLHFAWGRDGETLYVRQLEDVQPRWTVQADPQDLNAVRLHLIWERDASYDMVCYTELRLDLEDFTLTHIADRTQTRWTQVPPVVAQIEQQLGLLLRSSHAVGEHEQVYFYHRPVVLWYDELSGTVHHIDAPEWGDGTCMSGTVYWLGHNSGTVYRWNGRSWDGVITGLKQMTHCRTAAGLMVTGVTDSGAQAVADVLRAQIYELPENLGAPTYVYRHSADGPVVLVWEDLFRVRYLAVLDGENGQLKLLERQNIGGMTRLRGMPDDHRFLVVSSRTTGNVTVEIYDFS